MVTNFYADLLAARDAEHTVLETFQALSQDYTFSYVGDNSAYFYLGDILATTAGGRRIHIEVKDDSRVAETHNILCEDFVYFYSCGERKGNMHSNYDVYCVVSWQENLIYVIDFSVLRAHYKEGRYCVIPHAEQATYCYLLSLDKIQELGGLIATVNIKED